VQRVLAAFEKARRQVDAEDAGREGMMVNADRLTIAPPTVSQSPAQRGPMPRLSGRPNISNYAIGELVTMVRWVASDGRLRTDEELLAETVEALGFARRGSRIVERVSDAIRLLKSLPDWPA
jgi:hypothetical protein